MSHLSGHNTERTGSYRTMNSEGRRIACCTKTASDLLAGCPRLVLAFSRALTFVLLVCVLAGSGGRYALAQEFARQDVLLTERECKLKYAYLYSFSLLTTWPADAFETENSPFVIGVLGHKPYSNLLDQLAATRKSGSRRVLIRRFKTPDDYVDCHILYVTGSVSEQDSKAIVARTRKDPVLIVGESEGCEKAGGVMNFYFFGETVRFYLNLDEAHRRGLSANARLSKVATVVRAESTVGN